MDTFYRECLCDAYGNDLCPMHGPDSPYQRYMRDLQHRVIEEAKKARRGDPHSLNRAVDDLVEAEGWGRA